MSSASADSDSARLGHDSRLSSQRFNSERYEDYAGGESMTEEGFEEGFPPNIGGDVVEPPPLADEHGEFVANGPILPPPAEMGVEEGAALREWRRQNAIRLEEKEKREKEMVKQIIAEADAYKAEYYKKWRIRCDNSRAANREKEELFLGSRDKFHAEADKNYWKAIAELIPKEIPVIEKKGKKEKEKKPSIMVIQGPKPGKPTDLSRMRQILVKLKHKPPPHMMLPQPESGKDAKTQGTTPDAATTPTTMSVGKQGEASLGK